jgi:hypothetical protein
MAGSILDEFIEFFQLISSIQQHYDLGTDSASNRNEYIFLGVKGGQRVSLTTSPPSVS